jgi:RNA-binding protein
MIKLTVKQIQHLKALAHNLNPVVMIGAKGLSDSVIKEIDINLKAHELIKVRVFGDEREHRQAIIDQICSKTNSLLVQHIGKLLVLYRQAEKAKIVIPT